MQKGDIVIQAGAFLGQHAQQIPCARSGANNQQLASQQPPPQQDSQHNPRRERARGESTGRPTQRPRRHPARHGRRRATAPADAPTALEHERGGRAHADNQSAHAWRNGASPRTPRGDTDPSRRATADPTPDSTSPRMSAVTARFGRAHRNEPATKSQATQAPPVPISGTGSAPWSPAGV